MGASILGFLAANPLVLLFLVAAIGYPLGQLRVRGSSLGVAAVLFVGLGAGALDPRLALPEIVYMLGLAIFVYTVGLANGRAFVATLRRDGLRQGAMAVGVLLFATALTAALAKLLHLDAAIASGLFAGSLTNTPALAAAIETLKQIGFAGELSSPVVAYSIVYPMGVVGVILAVLLGLRVFRADLAGEGARLAELGAANEPLANATVRVTHDVGALTVEELVRGLRWRVIFGRLQRGGVMALVTHETRLRAGDLVTVVGTASELARVAARLGDTASEEIDLDRSEFDLRRVFVSNAEVAARPLRELDLERRFGAVVTRVRRGDVELLPSDDMNLEMGDRVRILAPARRLAEVAAFFGDSYRAASEVDVLTFGLGLALGLLLGALPLPLPGGAHISLGFAGGPLIVALVLGTLERTGPLLWNLPWGANTTLRQIGLVLFLAGIGTRAGPGFLQTFASGGGAAIFAAGALITFATAFASLWAAHRLLGIPLSLAIGMVAGIHTQPAVLGFAVEQTKNEIPHLGYAAVYPVATIAKILLVQVLLAMT
ncbi:MAG TPA: TrkA C-terminal domain-containing protein [Anaeromyxobacteraceae bacterium]|nr:TrkA C-terminal domain-containing protein [Anaeromyxobacteraceae bacterium]